MYWNYTHPFMAYNRSNAIAMAWNTIYAEDINDDGLNEVVFVSGTGWVYILNNNGTILNVFENEEMYFVGAGSGGLPFGQRSQGDIGRNTTTGTTVIGFATQKVPGADGYGYSFEYEPCYVSIDEAPAKVMKWNATRNTWRLYNSTGLAAGLHSYNITCNGNFSGYGVKNANGTFTIGGGAVTISFTLFTLGNAGTNFTNSMTSIPGNATEDYYFNATNPYAELVVPCAGADKTGCQAGMAIPAYRFRNTGSVTVNYFLNISSSLTGTGMKLCANSSAPAGSTATVVAVCSFSGEGNVNASDWLKVGGTVPVGSPNYEINVTIYLNITNAVIGTPITKVLTSNTTA
jgi:hypothetical protein